LKFFSLARAACVALVPAIPLAFAGAAGAATQPVASPAPSPSASPSGALRELGRVVTSDRRGEPISQTSRPTFVVDRARIDAYGARTVADALVGVPGVQLNSYGGFGAQVDYGIRGANSEQTLVLVDGQPVADAATGTANLQQMSTVGVERIEIVESGSSTLYGTSASGGVINVITRVPNGAGALVSDGSYSDRDAQASVGNGKIGVSYERHVATNDYGYPGFTYGPSTCYLAASGPCAITPGVRTNAYALQSTGRVSFDTPLGDGFSARARGDFAALDIGVPGSLTFSTPADTQGTANYSGLLEIAHSAGSSTQSLTLSGANQRLAYIDTSSGEDDTYTGRAQVSLRDTSTFGRADLVAGVDLSRASGDFTFPSAPIYNTSFEQIGTAPPFAIGARQAQSAAYAQFGYAPLAGTRITGGVRAEHDSPAGSVLAPSFGVVTRAGAFRLSGNLGESFRVPTLDDLYYPQYSNSNLLPEKAATADATLAYDVAGGSVSVGWFGRHGSNFIVSAPPNYIPYNAQRAVVDGLAFTAQSRPLAGLVADVSFTDLYRAEDLSLGDRLPREPGGQATLGVSRAFGRDRLAYGARWTIVGDDGEDADPSNVPPPLVNSYDAHDSLDAYLRYRFSKDVILSARGFNLGDERYVPIFGYPAPGRRLYLELSTQ
jgi:vitamin B12 transporter